MRKQLELLREQMKQRNLNLYLITMEDDHQSEQACSYFREIAEISGFTGSAGTLVVTMDRAALWTDGRYFVQAEKELEGSGVELMRAGLQGTPSMEQFILEHIPQGGRLGFNGKCISATEAEKIIRRLRKKKVSVAYTEDLPDVFWADRPSKTCEPCFLLEETYTGMSCGEKLAAIREKMEELGATVHIISTLDDIGWILNMRGHDVSCNPVFSSFLMITMNQVILYMDEGHQTEETSRYLRENQIRIKPEQEIYQEISQLHGETVLIEKERVSYFMIHALPSDAELISEMTPSTLMKCYKNPVERENIRRVHIKDGVAVTRFMRWFKDRVGKVPLTEWDAARKIDELRAEQEGFLENSFPPIAAYGPNAAMCHYVPSAEAHSLIQPKGLFLLDSGGHYYGGTTDITRTWSCGPVTEEERRHYTYVVQANLRLQNVVFLEGSRGISVDYAAREVLWKHHLNFEHGTGHGVGCCLIVHERPIGIRYKIVPERMDSYILQEGAFTSDEPGLYIAGSHGIRMENLMMCVKDVRNEYGQFLRFEPYTLCPMETEILMTELMTDEDVELVNAYNQKVCDTLCPYMTDEEQIWLKQVCAPIHK